MENKINIKHTYWCLLKQDNIIKYYGFNFVNKLDLFLSNIIVNASEYGKKDNVIATSHSIEEIQYLKESA